MPELSIFLPITKVDAVQHMVYGTLAEERVDKSNEVFDYASSKPFFQKWNEEFTKVTNGKSVGNLRSMHKAIAAGKFVTMDYDDTNKCINVGAKVVDPDEWQKVEEGVYTGFSVGGRYKDKWYDSNLNATRYTAIPSEGSLVDNPCMYGATFKLVKGEGVEELVKFTGEGVTNLTDEQKARLEELRKSADLTDEAKAELTQLEDLEKKVKVKDEKAADNDGGKKDEAKSDESDSTSNDGGKSGDESGNGGDGDGDKVGKAADAEKCDKCGKMKKGEGDNVCKCSAGTDTNKAADSEELKKVNDKADDLAKQVTGFSESLAKMNEGFETLKKSHEELSKSYTELQKSYDGIKAENEKLVKRVEILEAQPADGGVVVTAIEKVLNGAGIIGKAAPSNEKDLLKKMIADSNDLMEKQVLSQKLAMLEIKEAQKSPVKLT
jgi:hypothetical protein